METRTNRRKFIVSATCSICGSLILPSCAQVPLTNRSQLNLYDSNLPIVIFQGSIGGIPIPKVYANEKSLNKEIDKVYGKFLSKAKEDKILIDNSVESRKIEEIGKEIYTSINKYYLNKAEKNPVEGFNWQFALIESETKNAWCMPGGKIAFYSGILPICKNDDGIASLMGHEIAHALARHTVEKLTQHSILALGTQGLLSTSYGKVINENSDIYNNIVQFGIMLPFSRTMESEADYMGLAFMNMGGYNLEESVEVWKRMQSNTKNRYPEFMSSHPSPENRIENLKSWAKEIQI